LGYLEQLGDLKVQNLTVNYLIEHVKQVQNKDGIFIWIMGFSKCQVTPFGGKLNPLQMKPHKLSLKLKEIEPTSQNLHQQEMQDNSIFDGKSRN
jgi:hypothetical protein